MTNEREYIEMMIKGLETQLTAVTGLGDETSRIAIQNQIDMYRDRLSQLDEDPLEVIQNQGWVIVTYKQYQIINEFLLLHNTKFISEPLDDNADKIKVTTF